MTADNVLPNRARARAAAEIPFASTEPAQNTPPMLVVHVQVRVKPDFVEAFKRATVENAENSVREAGIARFDVLQQADDPTRFVLVEAYRTAEAPGRHKETVHYAKWRDAVAPMMAEPRSSLKFSNVFPADAASCAGLP